MAILHHISPLARRLRVWLGVVIALAFACTPIATIAHVEIEAAAPCSTDHDTASPASVDSASPINVSAVDKTDPQHQHSAHHCGTCHVHIMRGDFSPTPLKGMRKSIRRPTMSIGRLRSRSADHFRPPRV